MTDIPADVLKAARKIADHQWMSTIEKSGLARDIARAILADRAAQAERMATGMDDLAAQAFAAGRSRSSFAQEAEAAYDDVSDTARSALGGNADV